MAVAAGTRLGPYEISARIGAGGMGEVWRARDTRLDRNVAVKVLPAELANDAKFRVRFHREAKAISNLTHPHICTLYDVGHENGIDYLVMELLDGETLAARIARGPLPLNDVIRYGTQIAQALERAHREGIVHRDLKPGNVMVTKSGAKLLDFGLAKALQPEEGAGTAEHTAARSAITTRGTVVGTFQYMSPEQVQGKDVDHRSDIFALGIVLYEMVAGNRPFLGTTATSIMTAIIELDPAPVSPPLLDRVVQGCLAKDPDARTQSAHDVAMQLQWLSDAPLPPQRKAFAWSAVAIAALLAIMAGIALWKLRPSPQVTERRLAITAPRGTQFSRYASISPNGSRVVFRATDAQARTQLWLREIDSIDAKPLPGTEGAGFNFWSPDGKQIAFQARGKLLRLNVDTGEVRTLADGVSDSVGGSWSPNGAIVFARPESLLYRVNASGGEPVEETRLEATETHHMWPWFLPDGEHYLFMIMGSDQSRAGLYVGKLGSHDRVRVLQYPKRGEFALAVFGGGMIFYGRNYALFGQKFDWKRGALVGSPVKIDEDFEVGGPGRTTLSVSSAGTLLYKRGAAPNLAQLVRVDRTGKDIAPVGPPGPYYTFALSPDETRLAVTREDLSRMVWTIDVARGTATRAPFDRNASYPRWLSDSRSYLVSVSVDAPPNLFVDRRGTVARLTRAYQQHYTTSISADGKTAIFSAGVQNGFDIARVDLDPPHRVTTLIASRANETDGQLSPDGRWLAYVSTESGPAQVYVTTYPPSVQKWQISNSGGELPRWSYDGRELYFLDPSRTINAVKIEVGDGELRPGISQPLFTIDNSLDLGVTRKGEFVIARMRLNPDAPPLTVIEGWKP